MKDIIVPPGITLGAQHATGWPVFQGNRIIGHLIRYLGAFYGVNARSDSAKLPPTDSTTALHWLIEQDRIHANGKQMTAPIHRTDTIIAVDIETDGRYPGKNDGFSILSIGAEVIHDASQMFYKENGEPYYLGNPSLYIELQPQNSKFEKKAMEVNKLDRDRLVLEGLSPAAGIQTFCTWVQQFTDPVILIAPVAFDAAFLGYYTMHYLGISLQRAVAPCMDWRTHYAAKTGQGVAFCSTLEIERQLTAKGFRPLGRHTHNALDDAKHLAETFRFFEEQRRMDTTANTIALALTKEVG